MTGTIQRSDDQRFSYSALDDATRMVLRLREDSIKSELRRTVEGIVKIGEDLAAVQEALRHKRPGFQAWLSMAFGWSVRTAYRYIDVYEQFGSYANLAQLDIAAMALYRLVEDDTPEAARAEVLQLAESGNRIAIRDVEAAIEKHSPPEDTAPFQNADPPADDYQTTAWQSVGEPYALDEPPSSQEGVAYSENLLENSYQRMRQVASSISVTHPRFAGSPYPALCRNCGEIHSQWGADFSDRDDPTSNPIWLCKLCNSAEYDAQMTIITKQPNRSTGKRIPQTNSANPERDRCQTPAYALDPLLRYLPFGSLDTIWEPAAGEGLLVKALNDAGYRKVVSGDLQTGQDYFEIEPPDYDVMITNPPFSVYGKWTARAFELGKPFALLMPVGLIGVAWAQRLFHRYAVEIITMSLRPNFKTPNKGWDGSGAQFNVAWYTWGFHIGRPLTYFFFDPDLVVKRGSDRLHKRRVRRDDA